jgi:uncharacterized protein
MRKTPVLLLVLLTCPLFAGQHWPKPTGYVNDLANVIPADQARSLESLLTEVEQKTGAQIAVVTVPKVDGADIDGAAVDLFKAWGIGKKGKDDGILILAAIQDHKARIEVGYGLEGVITDGQAGSILRNYVFPYFKKGDYGQGLSNGTNEVALIIAQSQGITLNGLPNEFEEGPTISPGLLAIILLIVFVFIIFSVIARFLEGGYRGGRYGGGGGWGGGGWSGGGWGGGGGFGGFGGGGSGGGGASGSW